MLSLLLNKIKIAFPCIKKKSETPPPPDLRNKRSFIMKT